MSKALANDKSHNNPDASLFLPGCRGKVGFTSKRQANGRLRVMVRDGLTRRGMQLQSYKCKAKGCHKWHIGNSSHWRIAHES